MVWKAARELTKRRLRGGRIGDLREAHESMKRTAVKRNGRGAPKGAYDVFERGPWAPKKRRGGRTVKEKDPMIAHEKKKKGWRRLVVYQKV